MTVTRISEADCRFRDVDSSIALKNYRGSGLGYKLFFWPSSWLVVNLRSIEDSFLCQFSLLDQLLCERLDCRRPVELLGSRVTEVDPA